MDGLKVKIVLSYFRSCGYCPFTSLEKFDTQKSVRLMFICNFFQLTLISVIITLVVIYRDDIFLRLGMISIATDTLQWIFPVISHYVILIEPLFKRGINNQFWSRIRYIDLYLLGTTNQIKQQSINTYLCKLVALCLATLIIDLFIFFRITSYESWRNRIFATFYTFFMCRAKILFFVLFVDGLTCRTKMLTKRLKDIHGAKNKINLLRCCKRASELMWLCVEHVNDSFGMEFSFLWCFYQLNRFLKIFYRLVTIVNGNFVFFNDKH